MTPASHTPATCARAAARRLVLPAALALLAASCARVHAPVEPFGPPPTRADAKVRAIEQRHPAIATLKARLDVTARGVLFGKRQALVLLLYRDQPRALAVKASQKNLMGSFLRATVTEDRALVIAEAPEPRAYAGAPAEIRDQGGLVLGLMPDDLARVLLVGRTAARLAREAVRSGRGLPPPRLFRRHWRLEAPAGDGMPRQVLTVRRRDGLVRGLDLYNADGRRVLRARYEAFARYGGALLPSRFEIEAGRRRINLLVEAPEDGYQPGIRLTDRVFSTEAPAGLFARPLERLFLELPDAMRY